MHRTLLTALLLLAPAVTPDAAAEGLCSPGLMERCDPAPKPATNDVYARRTLAQALLDSGDVLAAAAELGAIAELRPDDSQAWLDYAVALADDARFHEAAAVIARALLLDPQGFEVNKVAVIAFEHTGREAEAFQANLRLSAMGDRIAMNDVAETLLNGRGATRDPHEAVQWFERAATAGHIGAMDRLARIYRDGLYGCSPDPALAAHWSKRAEKAD